MKALVGAKTWAGLNTLSLSYGVWSSMAEVFFWLVWDMPLLLLGSKRIFLMLEHECCIC